MSQDDTTILAFSHLIKEMLKIERDDTKNDLARLHDLDPQVGDAVKIRSDLKTDEIYGDLHFFSGMHSPHLIQVVARDGRHIRCENEFWYDISMIEKVFSERKQGEQS